MNGKGSYSDIRSGKEHPESSSCLRKCGRSLKNNLLIIILLISTVVGVVLGALLRSVGPFKEPELHPRELMYLQFPGEVVLNIMKLLTVPMIVCSLISGIGTLDSANCGKIGLRALCYYFCSTIIAVTEGLSWIFAVRPGADVKLANVGSTVRREYSSIDGFLDMIRNMFPDNIVTMTFQLAKTQISWTEKNITDLETNISKTVSIEQISNAYTPGINMLGTAIASLILGAMLQSMGERGRPLLNAFEVLFDVLMKMIKNFLYVAPIGITFMIASVVVKIPDPVAQVKAMFQFLLTLLAGEITHFFVTMPLLFFAFTRTNPYKHMYGCLKAFGMAFASSNSTMALPLTMDCLENNLGKNPKIVRFMCPIGATVNMDGGALYEAMMVVFLAQLRGMNMGFGEVITISLMAVMVSVGAATTSSGLVIYIVMLQSVGLPIEDAFLLLPFDPVMGRLRTCVNVWGDCVGVAVVEKLSQKELRASEPEQETQDSSRLEMIEQNGAAVDC